MTLTVPPTLVTPRLRLRAWRDDDLVMLAAYKLDPENWRYIAVGQPTIADDVQRLLDGFRREWESNDVGRWAINERDSDRVIGDCGFVLSPASPQLAYMIARDRWGRGFATEAARAALDWAFRAFTWPSILASTHRENVASQRVLGKLGMRPIARPAGAAADEVWYSIARNEWTARGRGAALW